MCLLFILNTQNQLDAAFVFIGIGNPVSGWAASSEAESLKETDSPPSSHQLPVAPWLEVELIVPLSCLCWDFVRLDLEISACSHSRCEFTSSVELKCWNFEEPNLGQNCAGNHERFEFLTAMAV